jgi:AcrR family transcriptional regulator
MQCLTNRRQISTADERSKAVLQTAVSVFADRGCFGTTTMDVAQRAGISQSYLYRLFPDRSGPAVAG